MRQIVLDTETTGLSVEKGHRIVEIGCLEMLERRPSGRTFHHYLNPQRPMDAGAMEVTGLTDDFLADKPLFAEIVEGFLEFVRGAEIIIHNAAFDVGFIDGELARLGRSERLREIARVVDSLEMARERYPGQRNSLDALCRRLGVENAHRTLHGALLDAELLADVYLAMTSGQGDLVLAIAAENQAARPGNAQALASVRRADARLRVRFADGQELERHAGRLAALAKGGKCLWPAEDEAFSASGGVA